MMQEKDNFQVVKKTTPWKIKSTHFGTHKEIFTTALCDATILFLFQLVSVFFNNEIKEISILICQLY